VRRKVQIGEESKKTQLDSEKLLSQPKAAQFAAPLLVQLQNLQLTMESLDGTSYDVLISGTGIQQSLLALYVSSCFAV